MSSESKLVIELWDYFRDMIASSKRQDAATHLLRLFQEYGIEVEQAEIEGECEYLDEAIIAVIDDDHQEDDYDNEDE
jgi:hypothetical protein